MLYDGNKILRLPREVHFVTPEYVSECIAHGGLQPERTFLIDIVCMAILASDQQVPCHFYFSVGHVCCLMIIVIAWSANSKPEAFFKSMSYLCKPCETPAFVLRRETILSRPDARDCQISMLPKQTIHIIKERPINRIRQVLFYKSGDRR
jgi:hypothetical protein